MPNHLIHENSPYLLQHADNPVDWYPWGEEAISLAQKENKPIFLSIGYAACHWCHVMAHESFEDIETANILNQNFINIKVDREERPDIDHIYMNAVIAMTGQGGWPLSVFLLPDGKPFFGGTYFPKSPRFGMPSFKELLIRIIQLWQTDQFSITQSAQNLTTHLKKINAVYPSRQYNLSEDKLTIAEETLLSMYDWKNGGWGSAPKFPQSMAIQFLLNRSFKSKTDAQNTAHHALLSMAKGGMYDLVGGGFARYSVDAKWIVPHFEKMLYDNALLAKAYLHGYLFTGDEMLRRICTQTLEFVNREMTHHKGCFMSSLDADSEGEEGKYYTWSMDELSSIFDENELDWVIKTYNVTREGNFEGKNVLFQLKSDEELANDFDYTLDQFWQEKDKINQKLFNSRQSRTRPATDDKAIVVWNALMAISFAEAGRFLDQPRYYQIAKQNLKFITQHMYDGEKLYRSWRNGQAQHYALLEDYAALILALLTLYQCDGDVHWYTISTQLAQYVIKNFADPNNGFYDTPEYLDHIIIRPKNIQDNATPSGNALAVEAFLKLYYLSGESTYLDIVDNTIRLVVDQIDRYPLAYSHWLTVLDLYLKPHAEVVILGQDDLLSHPLAQTALKTYNPYMTLVLSGYPPADEGPPILRDRPLLNNMPTAYVCENFTCKHPTNNLDEFIKQLGDITHDTRSS